MLAEVTVENTEAIVYTVPQGKKAMIEVIINPLTVVNAYVKMNGKMLFDEVFEEQIGQKLILSQLDEIRVGTDGTVNVFISGMEV